VKKLVDDLTGSIKDKKQDTPDIIGIVVSLTHDSYEMYCQGNEEPLFFLSVIALQRVLKKINMDVLFPHKDATTRRSIRHPSTKQISAFIDHSESRQLFVPAIYPWLTLATFALISTNDVSLMSLV
jgi:hypothetical protein